VNLVRIIIATTQGPVTVQRITEEDPVVNSVVCLSGKAVALAISPAYDAFVRNPTGVIQRHYGHPAFRVDVSEKIDEGYSWQLGLFAAHALYHSGQLAQQDQACARTVIATGELDRDLNLLAVSGNEEKTAALRSAIEALVEKSVAVTLVVPKQNAAHWISHFSDLTDRASPSIEILPIETAGQLLDHLGLSLPGQPQHRKPAAPQPTARGKSSWLAAALVFLIGAVAVAGGSSYHPQLKALSDQALGSLQALLAPSPSENAAGEKPAPVAGPTPGLADPAEKPPRAIPAPVEKPAPPPQPVTRPTPVESGPLIAERDVLVASRRPATIAAPLRIELSERRAPLGFSCEEAHQMAIEAQVRPPTMRGAIALFGKANDKLCTVEVLAKAASNSDHVFGRYQRWTQGRPRDTEPDKVIDLGPRQGPVSWSVDIPNQLSRPAVFQILILSSNKAFEVTDQMHRRLASIRPGSDQLIRLQNRLRADGIKLTTRQFRILPERRSRTTRPPQADATGAGQFQPERLTSPPSAR